jgi:succinate dehydrogenase / fumarate reductase iron-sulfur subunit
MGPAALLQAARFVEDSRDDQSQARLEKMNDAYSVFRCKTIMNCADVCPKGLNPTQAIATIRTEMLDKDL